MGACLCKTKRRSTSNGLRADPELYNSDASSSSSGSSSGSTNIRQRATGLLDALSLSGSFVDLVQNNNRTHHNHHHRHHSHHHHDHHHHHHSAHKLANHRSQSHHGHRHSHNKQRGDEHQDDYGTGADQNNRIWCLQSKLSMHADRLVFDTLESIRPSVLNEPSNAIQKLHLISETELGWLVVINSLINKVDLEHPFGSALILLIVEDAPLPTRKSIGQLDELLGLHMNTERSVSRQRNISIVLGCLAEKLAGTLSSTLFTENVQSYLLSRLQPIVNKPNVILFSLIALEKFSQTIDNKSLLVKKLTKLGAKNPLLELEKFKDSADLVEQQVGFCAAWQLDNHFLYEGRPYTYQTIDKDNLNVMLNPRDASENLKISADGLTARNDTSRFESVRCTYAMTSGIYYYEVRLITPGVMQIGFATKQSKFLNHDGFGIGDDDQSFAYDGCRQLLWQNAKSIHTDLPRWKENDIVGCLIDLEKFEIRFSLNGKMSGPSSELFKNKPLSTQYYAAASFMPFQQCVFNFGRVPFVHPPEIYNFRTFNQCATLKEDDKIIMPRHLLLNNVHSSNMFMDVCNICCDNLAQITLKPCEHSGFCETCANLLDLCPLCRTVITSRALAMLS